MIVTGELHTLAKFAAVRRASPRVSRLVAERAALFERCDVCRKIPGLCARQFHVRHLRMWSEQEQRDLGGIEARYLCNSREWRRLISRGAVLRS
jgi:hypothetical protein